jgi:hypothetical protein
MIQRNEQPRTEAETPPELLRSFGQEFVAGPQAACRRLSEAVLSSEISAEVASELLLPFLVKAPYARENLIYNTLLELAAPADILDASLATYARRNDPRLLEAAAGIIEYYGEAAWPVLMQLASSRRPECRYFLETIAVLKGVPSDERLRGLLELARNRDPDTQGDLMDVVERVAPEHALAVWQVLAESPEDAIRTAAEERIASLRD